MSYLSKVLPGILLAVGVSASAVLLVTPTPAQAEKTAEQIKCEEEGGTWQDKGNGNTFCFKKLPPMLKAGGPSSYSGHQTAGVIKIWLDHDCDGKADMAIDEQGLYLHKGDYLPAQTRGGSANRRGSFDAFLKIEGVAGEKIARAAAACRK
jgi:hypothetical protein